jgi:hypothetical protein
VPGAALCRETGHMFSNVLEFGFCSKSMHMHHDVGPRSRKPVFWAENSTGFIPIMTKKQ